MEKINPAREEGIGRRFRQVGAELRKLRSKSCGRVFAQKMEDVVVDVIADSAKGTKSTVDELQGMECYTSHMSGPYQGWARALVDYVPSPYDKVALPFRAGQLIHLTQKGEGGLWWGECGGELLSVSVSKW